MKRPKAHLWVIKMKDIGRLLLRLYSLFLLTHNTTEREDNHRRQAQMLQAMYGRMYRLLMLNTILGRRLQRVFIPDWMMRINASNTSNGCCFRSGTLYKETSSR